MKRSIPLEGGIEPLFGALDENLRLFESTFRVSTHLGDRTLEIEGEEETVGRAARLLEDYNALIREGRVFSSGEVKSLLRAAAAEPPSVTACATATSAGRPA